MSDKPTVITTPKGSVFGFVNILKPDTKFNPEGDYKIKLSIPKTAKGLEAQLEAIESARDAAKAEFQKDPKNKGKRLKEADLPFYEDDNGNIIISFKSKATWVDRKTNETKQRVIPIFGGAGRLKPNEIPQFGQGSEVKVAYTINGFCNAALGAGASLRIDSLKLIKPVAFTGGAQNHFADDEDEGYVPDSEGGSFSGSDDDGDGYTPGASADDGDGDF